MEERDWQIIKTLYEQKNITKTARVLYMSQPTLTARIKQIEESLGTKLLYRGNKGITFTETVDSRICIQKRNLMYRLHKAVML